MIFSALFMHRRWADPSIFSLASNLALHLSSVPWYVATYLSGVNSGITLAPESWDCGWVTTPSWCFCFAHGFWESELKSSCQHGTCFQSHHPSSSSFKLHITWEERIECWETSQDLLESVFKTVHVEAYPVNNM